jgi:formate hydrogenlyase subunit 3/multisubunit Na+/H+ antiporter MnhD subunit
MAILSPICFSILVFSTYRKGYRLITKIYTLTGVILSFLFVLGSYPRAYGVVELLLPHFLDFGLSFRVDRLSFVFGFLITLIWIIATVYSFIYMEHEHNQIRFYIFWLLSLGGCLGVVFTGDFFSLFLFFEIMTISSFVIVIHEEQKEAVSAGYLYIFLGIIGGLALLFGILLLFHWTGTLRMVPILNLIYLGQNNYWLLAFLFTVGFGIKAGMVPLHIWLPKAHPVAPTPASAVLSGVMIKTGIYGLIRIFNTVLVPVTWEGMEEYYKATTGTAGNIFIWLGLLTMLLGAFIATQNTNTKRILAYSSVSQIGYIVMGIGTAAYLGEHGAVAMAGSIYHVINHGIFKSGLFMLIGTILLYTHKIDLRDLGGLAKKAPFLMFVFLFAAFGIMGVPGFNGYTSKTLLHHAIVEAYEYKNVIWFYYGEWIFTLASALTVCYFTKLFIGIFLAKPKEDYHLEPINKIMKITLGIFPLIIMLIGLNPKFLLEGFINPSMNLFPYDSYFVKKYLVTMDFWYSKDVISSLVTLGLGFILYFIFSKFSLFKLRFPSFMSIENIFYYPASRLMMLFCRQCTVNIDGRVSWMYRLTGKSLLIFCQKIGELEESQTFNKIGRVSMDIIEIVGHLEDKASSPENLEKLAAPLSDKIVDGKNFKKDKGEKEKHNFSTTWQLGNLNFDALLIAAMLVILISLLFFGFTIF